MKIDIDAIHITIDIPKLYKYKTTTKGHDKDAHLHLLRENIIRGWPKSKNMVPQEIRSYWTFKYDMPLKDGFILKGRCISVSQKIAKSGIGSTGQ